MIKKAIVFLYSVIVVVLAVATFVENSYGTRFVTENVYHTAWFCALWAALAVLSVVLFVVRGLWRRVPVALLHASFIVILIGALTTFLTSNKGMLHIRKEMPVDSYIIPDRGSMMRLPFKMELDSFVVECYQGTEAPSDYISYVSVGDENVRISMNNIFARNRHNLCRISASGFVYDTCPSVEKLRIPQIAEESGIEERLSFAHADACRCQCFGFCSANRKTGAGR